jgi:hypothetical protein
MRLVIFIFLLISFNSFSQGVGSQDVIRSWKDIAEDKTLSAEERSSAYLMIIHKSKNQPDSVLIDAYQKPRSFGSFRGEVQ